jgi:hypothetical protein
MSPLLNSMNGEGKLSSKEVEVSNSKTFAKLADVLKNDKYKTVKMNDLKFTFHIRDGRVYIDPFDTKMFGNKVNIGGDQGLDQTLNYLMKMSIPRSELGSANQLLSGLGAVGKGVNTAMGDVLMANITIKGTCSDPKVGLGLGNSEGKSTKDVAKEQVKQVISEKKAAVKEDLSKKAEEIMTQARQQADAVKSSAKQAADIVRKESDDKANAVVSNAGGNPIAKAAAKESAKKIRKEGNDKAQQMEDEASRKSDDILKKAQADADKLKK